MKQLYDAYCKLRKYIEKNNYKGYDPYDTLNSYIPIKKLGTFLSTVAIQLQKRNSVNIRPLLGIKKDYNPKGLGLLLKAYSLHYKRTNDPESVKNADKLFKLLKDNSSKGYSGACWGYNFDWASPGSFLEKYTPSVVVTAFVVDGLLEYYNITKKEDVKELIISTGDFIVKDLVFSDTSTAFSISYTSKSKGYCYNASLLGAETLAKIYSLNGNSKYLEIADKAVTYVVSQQKDNGSWYYSYDPVTNSERKQIDFHQGFILVSLNNFLLFSRKNETLIQNSIKLGLEFYYQKQFSKDGVSLWRLPKKYPVEIHNQAQGIITFSLLKEFNQGYLTWAGNILDWTINNMQDKKGFFYYQKFKYYTNKIPYMRWSQAWMLLAFEEYLNAISLNT